MSSGDQTLQELLVYLIEKAIIEYEGMSSGHIAQGKFYHFPTNALSFTKGKQL